VKRPGHLRIGAVFLALLLVFVEAGELVSAHPCTLHDPALYTAGMAHDDGSGHHAHGDEAAHHDESGHGAPEGHSVPCTCQGACVAPSAAALPEEASIVVDGVVTSVLPVTVTSGEVFFPRLIPFFLPFSQAPPSLG